MEVYKFKHTNETNTGKTGRLNIIDNGLHGGKTWWVFCFSALIYMNLMFALEGMFNSIEHCKNTLARVSWSRQNKALYVIV
jgi:hypothetical protein